MFQPASSPGKLATRSHSRRRRLRHGAATLLLGTGVHPRVAQQLLRHASSKTTTEICSHLTAAQERQAAEVLEAALVG